MATIEAPAPGRARGARRTRKPGSRVGGWASPVTSYYLIAGVTGLLLTLGLVMVLSSSTVTSIWKNAGNPYAEFLGQAKFALIGLPVMLVASRMPVSFYKRLAWPALVIGFALQALVLTPLALEEGGNRNWVLIPGINQVFQPSEFLKVSIVIWLGAVLAAKKPRLDDWRHVVVPGGIVVLAACGLVYYGNDLGTVLILLAITAGALYVAGVPAWMFTVSGVAAALGAAALVVTNANRLARVKATLGLGDVDAMGAGFQSQHALWGLGTGGISGVGLGASREKWLYLPAAHNDFIFAIIGEELGLLGTLLVLLLFGALAVGFTRVVARHEDPFVQIATGAAAAWIIGQALINIGSVIKVLPIIGVNLPLVSAGGSALITAMAVIGMVLAFARSEPGAAEALSTRRGALRRTLAVISPRGRRG